MPIRVAIIDDHPLMLKAITDLLSGKSQFEVVGTATKGSELPRIIRENSPDVLILDLGLDQGNFEPVGEIRYLLREYPKLKILVLTGYEDQVYVKHIIDAGAVGYILKSDDLSMSLPEGIQRVYDGLHYYSEDVLEQHFAAQTLEVESLNEREIIALRLSAEGKSNASIAQNMKVAEKTVRNLLSSAYSKLGIEGNEKENPRVAAINKARKLGLLKED